METTERERVADPGADGTGRRDVASRLTRPWTAALVAVLAVLFSGALIGVVGQAEHTPSPLDALPRGSQSAQAAELAEQLPDADASTASCSSAATAGGADRAGPRGRRAAVRRRGRAGRTRAGPQRGRHRRPRRGRRRGRPTHGRRRGDALRADLRADRPPGSPHR